MVATIKDRIATITDPGRGWQAENCEGCNTLNHNLWNKRLKNNPLLDAIRKNTEFDKDFTELFGLKKIVYGTSKKASDRHGEGPLSQYESSCAYSSIAGVLMYNAGVKTRLPELPKPILQAVVCKLLRLADRKEDFDVEWNNEWNNELNNEVKIFRGCNEFLRQLFIR